MNDSGQCGRCAACAGCSKVSHGGFYAWVGRSPSHRALANERLTGLVRQRFAQSDRTYGSPRVWRDLIDWGERVGENRVARLMHQAHLQSTAPALDARPGQPGSV